MILTTLLPQGGGIMTIGTIGVIVGGLFLVLLKWLFKDEESTSQDEGIYGDSFKEEPEFDRTWSSLPGNVFNRSNDD
jgi:hypothetical protein